MLARPEPVVLEHEADRVDHRGRDVVAVPRSGRFEAISTSGRPLPAINSPQALAGSTPLLDPPATLTHAEPAPAASAWAAPTGTRAVTWLVAGSTRETVLSFQFATHTAPSPNAT